MKNTRLDQRRATLHYKHDADTGRTIIVIDIDAPEDDMPHEHRRDLRLLAEEILGIPIDQLPDGFSVELRRKPSDHHHEEGSDDHEHTPAQDLGARKGTPTAQ